MKRTFIHIQLLVFVFGFLSQVKAQNLPNNNTRKVINAHIEYVNLCTNYIEAVTLRIKPFNSKLNNYYESANLERAEKYLESFEVRFEGSPAAYKIFPAALRVKYAALIKSRENLNGSIRKEITATLNSYQSEFDIFLNAVDSIKTVSQNSKLFFKDPKFTKIYKLLHTIENQIATLTQQNDVFFNTAQKLFGTETLPVVLQRTKNIALLLKKMKQQMRGAQKEALRSSVEQFEKFIAIRNWSDDLKALEFFGDFDYYDYRNTQGRANITRSTRWLIKVFKDYLANKPPPCDWFFLKNYDNHYCWVNRINDFHDAGSTTIGQYNRYVKRANVAVLYIIEEVQPFKLLLPEGKEPFPITTVTPILAPILEVDISTNEDLSKDSIPQEIVQKPLFKKDDVSTLNGSKTNNLVLLLDVSASMQLNNNSSKLKKAINHLIDVLRPQDKLTVISYSGRPKKILETSSNYDKQALKTIINELQSKGNTNARIALKMAYVTCNENYIKNGNNRIIIASDGDFKIDKTLKKQIKAKANDGLYLSTFHFITEKLHGKRTLKSLADIGLGSYSAIHSEADAVNVLIGESKQKN